MAQAVMEREAFPFPEADGREGQPALQDRAPSSDRMPGSRVPAPLLPSRPAEAVPAPAIAIDPGIGNFRYRLGPGDRLSMSVFMVKGYEGQVEVLGDGTVNLPRLGSVPVWGLTLDEARQRITEGYDRFLRNPLVDLDLLAPRPVRVTLLGEVQKPGFYTLTQ
ncbi:MAG: polysaccharide biosynthesis/export family protein, partial [Prochlorococcaceae cyanobacterium]